MIGKRRLESSNVQIVWFRDTASEGEMEVGKGAEERRWGVAVNKDDTETGRTEAGIGREELDDAEAERVKGKEEAERTMVTGSEKWQL